MNMLSVLPVSGWGKKEEIRAIWEAVTSIVVANSGVYSLCVVYTGRVVVLYSQ